MPPIRKAIFSRRVLFLDFDGVVSPGPITEPGMRAVPVHVPHFAWVPLLAKLLEPHPDVGVVVHSSWRANYDDDELSELLEGLEDRLIGATPRHLARYPSILMWLAAAQARLPYRILDDDPSEFPSPPPPELILCDPNAGLSGTRVLSALRDWLQATRVPNGR
jgi:hypothetical protein